MEAEEKLELGQSPNPAEENLKKLAELIPEAFSEGSLDIEALKRALGKDGAASGERYQLSWAGKADAYKVLQQPTTATLRPQREPFVDLPFWKRYTADSPRRGAPGIARRTVHS